jgi:uncharacterized membrane protein YjdF
LDSQRRLKNLDWFLLLNLVLLSVKRWLRGYPRFVSYYGLDRIAEFWIYAIAIMVALVVLWALFRHYTFSSGLLALVQVGILLHLAGGFVIVNGQRLYDTAYNGLGYDKLVHATNSFIACVLVARIFVIQGIRATAINRVFVALVVLGLGGIVELVEYAVTRAYPRNGVGDYGNNMQDLLANFGGGLLYWMLVAMHQSPIRLHQPFKRGPAPEAPVVGP